MGQLGDIQYDRCNGIELFLQTYDSGNGYSDPPHASHPFCPFCNSRIASHLVAVAASPPTFQREPSRGGHIMILSPSLSQRWLAAIKEQPSPCLQLPPLTVISAPPGAVGRVMPMSCGELNTVDPQMTKEMVRGTPRSTFRGSSQLRSNSPKKSVLVSNVA